MWTMQRRLLFMDRAKHSEDVRLHVTVGRVLYKAYSAEVELHSRSHFLRVLPELHKQLFYHCAALSNQRQWTLDESPVWFCLHGPSDSSGLSPTKGPHSFLWDLCSWALSSICWRVMCLSDKERKGCKGAKEEAFQSWHTVTENNMTVVQTKLIVSIV